MRSFLSTTASVLLAIATFGTSTTLASVECHAGSAPEELLAIRSTLDDGLQARQIPTNNSSGIEVPVYFHVITSGHTLADGWVPGESITEQMDIMNRGFKKANIRFTLKAVDYIVNATWAKSNGDVGLEERQRLTRKGDYRTLNIVLIPGLGNGGRCTYPGRFSERNLLFDRCEVGTAALPKVAGRAGRTTIHEVGHWMGLMHTFEGGCDGTGDNKGDLVADTPPHKHEVFAIADCPAGVVLNTCPDQPGNDPTNNYMSYFAEKCMNEENGFTPGQAARMQKVWAELRRDSPDVLPQPAKIVPKGGQQQVQQGQQKPNPIPPQQNQQQNQQQKKPAGSAKFRRIARM